MKSQKSKPKIIVILGPTASGKSDLAVKLAKKYKGEVISADSRQVYTGLNLGTGKITKKEMLGVPHHLLDVASPKTTFSVHDFKKKAELAITDILKRKKVPIICGGTGFYIQALVDNIVLPEVKPNLKLRKELQTKSIQELFSMLVMLDHKRANTIDPNNPHRLIRAIEIATALGKVPKIKAKPKYESLQIGIETPDEILKQNIYKRLIKRMKIGMVKEAKKLHEEGLSCKRMEALGLEYKYLALYLQKKISKPEMLKHIEDATWQYVKRQKTWFKRDSRIHWVNIHDMKKILALMSNL